MTADIKEFQQNLARRDYFLAASLGLIPGVSTEVKFGHCPNAAAAATDVWEYGATQALYIFPATSGEAIEMVSDDETDDQEITIVGLDENGLDQTVSVNLTGDTEVAIPGLWTAVNMAYNSDSTVHDGEVLIQGDGSTSTNIFATLCADCQQTSQAIYKLASNKVAAIVNLSTSMNKPLGATVSTIYNAEISAPGKVFRTQIRYGLQENGTSNISSNLIIPEIIGPGYMAKIVGTPSTGPSDISGEFSMLLFDKELVPSTLLAAL